MMEQWERLKSVEKSERESLMDGIPKGLPALARAHKVAGKMEKAKYKKKVEKVPPFESEERLGSLLWEICYEARKKGLHPEHALRKTLLDEESTFREWEREQA